MLLVGDGLDDFLNVDGVAHLVLVLLAVETAGVDEVVRVGDNTRHGTHNMVVHLVELA